MKKLNLFATGVLAAMLGAPAFSFAQVKGNIQPNTGERIVSKQASQPLDKRYEAFAEAHPALAKVLKSRIQYAPQKQANTVGPVAPRKAPAANGRTLWGNVVARTDWQTDQLGMYSFNASNPITVSTVGINNAMEANAGAALFDGVFHFVKYQQVSSYYDPVVSYNEISARSWTTIGTPEVITDYSKVALETALDKKTGTIYGEFYNSTATGFEVGTIEYPSLVRTTIGTAQRQYIALGVTSEGVLYGIDEYGDLYKLVPTILGVIDEQKIGATGINPLNSNNQYYQQSGEIDQSDNTFYWASIDGDENSKLVSVDLNTGRAIPVADFPHAEQVYSLLIPDPVPDAGAPDSVKNVSIAADGPSTQATVTFTAPTTTYGGATLSGTVVYHILVNGEDVRAGNVSVGATRSVKIQAPEGMDQFSVYAENATGNGPAKNIKRWIGYDEPQPVSNIDIESDINTEKASFSWTAPTKGIHDGYVGPLTYNIVRYPDSTTVATGITDTKYSETITDPELRGYTYAIIPVNGTQKGEPAVSGKAVLGTPISTPWYDTFPDDTDKWGHVPHFDLYTVIDANHDGKTWIQYYKGGGSVRTDMLEYNDPMQTMDDWFITPPVKLKAGIAYNITWNVEAGYEDHPETFECKWGTKPTVAGLNNTLFPLTTYAKEEPKNYTNDLVVDKDGAYYFGFHLTTDKANGFWLNIDSLAIEEAAKATAPDTVTALSINPAANGNLQATISFKAPSRSLNGQALTSISRIEVYRNDELVKTFTNPAVGAQLSFTDDGVTKNGNNTYTIVAYNGEDKGLAYTATAYVGVDVPLAPTNVKLADGQNEARMSWTAVSNKGANNLPVQPDKVKYKIYDVINGQYYNPNAPVDSIVGGTQLSIKKNLDEGPQDILHYVIDGTNVAGTGRAAVTNGLPVGKPYSLPVIDEVGQRGFSHLWWTQRSDTSRVFMNLSSQQSANADNASFEFLARNAGDDGALTSGKINTAGANDPQVVFSYYGTPGSDDKIDVQIVKADGSAETIGTVDFSKLSGNAAWQQEFFAIPAKYASERYVMVRFSFKGNDTSNPVYIDDINILDVKDNNLAVELSAPASLDKSATAQVNVQVFNRGWNNARRYELKLFADDEVVADTTITSGLINSFSSRTFRFNYSPTIFNKNDSVQLKAEVALSGDEYADDNTASIKIGLNSSESPQVENVTLQKKGESTVNVSWNAPSKTNFEVTEDFEEATPWAVDDVKGWTFYDAGGTATGGWPTWTYPEASYPNLGEPFAFIVFNPTDTANIKLRASDLEAMSAHSGSQYLARPWGYEDNEYPALDEWAVSPKLYGGEQTISFWARNYNETSEKHPEMFEVYYSKGSNALANFIYVAIAKTTINSGEWTKYSAKLPDGATYFGIHCISNSENSFWFMLDDITYTYGEKAPVGFNVYRDGKLLANVKDITTYTDAAAVNADNYTYSVTALYADGTESVPVNASLNTTGISVPVVSSADGHDVYTIDGIRVSKNAKGLDGLRQGVYIINGKKVIKK